MRKLTLLALLFLPSVAFAGGGSQLCSPVVTRVSALGMDSSRSFSYDGPGTSDYGLAVLYIDLTDANSSITKFTTTCTVSYDGNTSDFTPQECSSASGTYNCVDTGVWNKGDGITGPGTKKWPLRLDIEGFQDFECTFSVGSGSGAAGDLLTVKTQLCTKG